MSAEMNPKEQNDDDFGKLDETLRRFLASELDGQLGRARAAFEARARQSARPTRGRRRSARLWVIGLAGAAMAASIAAVWAVPLLRKPTGTMIVGPTEPRHPPSSRPGGRPTEIVSADWQQVQQVTSTATLDQGVVVLDGEAPARIVRSVSMQRTEWVDPARNVRVETAVPREQVMLIRMDTY